MSTAGEEHDSQNLYLVCPCGGDRAGVLTGPSAHQNGVVVIAGLALLVAALGEAVARLPAGACERLVRSAPPQAPARQLLIGWSRCAVVLGAGTGTVATVLAVLDPAWSWDAAATATAAGLLPLVAAPLTAAPLLGAPLRLGLLGWCTVRVLHSLGTAPAALVAVLAGCGAAAGAGRVLGRRPLGAAVRRTVRDTASVLIASPIVLAVGVVPLLLGLPLAPWELWRACRCRPAGESPPAGEPPPETAAPELFVVYLDGVGKTRRAPTRVAEGLANALEAVMPGARFVTDVLPYSPLQFPLTERAVSGWVWRRLRRHAFPVLVGHNILQTLVATDARYQQAYGHALAAAVAAALRRAGHRPGERAALVGYSGAAVVGMALADPLTDLIGGPPPLLISLGGYFDGARVPERAQVHHVASRADRLEWLGRVMFPARWPAARHSPWNRALARATARQHPVRGPRHIGPHGYLGTVKAADGSSNVSNTAAVTARLLHPGLQR